MTFKLDAAERAALSAQVDDKLLEGLAAMERFTRRLFAHLGIRFEEVEPGVLKVPADKKHGELLRKPHLLVFDPAVYPSVEDQNAELLTPASPLFRNLLAKSEGVGPIAFLSTRRATPYTMFHFHVHLKGMNFEWEDVITIGVDDDGDAVQGTPQLRDLLELVDPLEGVEGETDAADAPMNRSPDETGPEHKQNPDPGPAPAPAPAATGRNLAFKARDVKDVPVEQRRPPEKALQEAPHLIKEQIAPKLDELTAAVETGLRKTQERLAAYYEQMRDESRREDVKLRRRIGQINAKIFYTEDRIRLLRLEKERDLLAEELDKVKRKSRRAMEHLELEERERLAKEAERARPTVKIRLVAATRVVPE